MELLSDFVCFHQYSWWKRIKICWFEKHFDYPVVYSDGLISQRKADHSDRVPLGILFLGYLIPLQGYEKEITPDDAMKYCQSITFAGISCVLPSWDLLDAIKSERVQINSLLTELGGQPFKSDWYLVLGYKESHKFSCIHFMYPDRTIYIPSNSDSLIVRPVFYLPL